MNLTSEQQKELQAVLCDAFNEPELAQVVRYRLDDVLQNLVPPGPFRHVVFELIGVYHRRGAVEKLIEAIRLERPDNQAVKDFIDRLSETKNPQHEEAAREPATAPVRIAQIDPEDPFIAIGSRLTEAVVSRSGGSAATRAGKKKLKSVWWAGGGVVIAGALTIAIVAAVDNKQNKVGPNPSPPGAKDSLQKSGNVIEGLVIDVPLKDVRRINFVLFSARTSRLSISADLTTGPGGTKTKPVLLKLDEDQAKALLDDPKVTLQMEDGKLFRTSVAIERMVD